VLQPSSNNVHGNHEPNVSIDPSIRGGGLGMCVPAQCCVVYVELEIQTGVQVGPAAIGGG
jgi:hypothetical protein